MDKEKSVEMNKEEVIKQLKDLIEDRKSFCAGDYDPIFDRDIEALKYAIKELEKTALEVPVQEQLHMNFNPKTGEKMNDICPRCWVKGNKPFNCGFNTCPGYKLLTLLK